jgi:hypothetical protein
MRTFIFLAIVAMTFPAAAHAQAPATGAVQPNKLPAVAAPKVGDATTTDAAVAPSIGQDTTTAVNPSGDQWRYVWQNNTWWYYLPNNQWLYWANDQWNNYVPPAQRPAQSYGYSRPSYRSYSRPRVSVGLGFGSGGYPYGYGYPGYGWGSPYGGYRGYGGFGGYPYGGYGRSGFGVGIGIY